MTSGTLHFPLQFLVFPGSTYGETGQVWSLGWSGAETGHEAPVRLEYTVSESKVKAPSLQLSKSLRVPLRAHRFTLPLQVSSSHTPRLATE